MVAVGNVTGNENKARVCQDKLPIETNSKKLSMRLAVISSKYFMVPENNADFSLVVPECCV